MSIPEKSQGSNSDRDLEAETEAETTEEHRWLEHVQFAFSYSPYPPA